MAWHIRKYPIHAQDTPKLFTDYPGQKKKKNWKKRKLLYMHMLCLMWYWQSRQLVRHELGARTVINRLHFRSLGGTPSYLKCLGTPHLDLVASKTPGLRNQEPQVQKKKYALSSSTSAKVTLRLIIMHLHCDFSPHPRLSWQLLYKPCRVRNSALQPVGGVPQVIRSSLHYRCPIPDLRPCSLKRKGPL